MNNSYKSKIIEKEKLKYITFDIFNEEEVVALYTTKCGGVSTGDAASLNMSFKFEESHENVLENMKIIADATGMNYNNMTISDQQHGTNILVITEDLIGSGIHKELSYDNIDGLVTNLKNVPLVTLYADCVPLYFYDKEKKIIGVAHAGWKGTVKNIASNIIKVMLTEFNCNTKDIVACIGPSICNKCFEVDGDVVEEVSKTDLTIEEKKEVIKELPDGKALVDLKKINEMFIKRAGILDENIQISDLCTCCQTDLFHSHRKQGTKRGSQAAIMMLK